MASRHHDEIRERILRAALEMAEEAGSWEAVRLRLVAVRAGLPLTEVLSRFRDLDAVADAWFAKGWEAMLAPPPEGFYVLPARERLEVLLLRWFDALAEHRRLTAEMVRIKLHPPHPHHWVPMVFNLSRTIQWLRDAAALDGLGARRGIEEVGLTLLFLRTLAVWSCDRSEGQGRTRAFLRRRLACADRAMACYGRLERRGRGFGRTADQAV